MTINSVIWGRSSARGGRRRDHNTAPLGPPHRNSPSARGAKPRRSGASCLGEAISVYPARSPSRTGGTGQPLPRKASAMQDPRSILITGASGGIGGALARAYAGPGVRLALTGRNPERLGACADACRASGAEVRSEVLDVVDSQAFARWVEAIDHDWPLDLV